jgi:16S rRNA (adenine1518-N6/adenine1519-N6)-dimethyltransferase
MRPDGPRGRTLRQALGRHYLASPGILARIVESIDPRPADLVIEIGPGRGALTYPLAERAGRVVAVEKDPEAVAVLLRDPRPSLEVIAADVLNVDLGALAAERRSPSGTVKLAGNLPYSISTPFLYKVLDERTSFDRAAFLVQKEIAEKVCARPGGKAYGPLSIRLQAQFYARIEFPVRPGSFVPPPKVDSAFFTLRKRETALVGPDEEPAFGRFLSLAFRRRRRTLCNNLTTGGYPKAAIGSAMDAAGIGKTARPESVEVEAFLRLFLELKGGKPDGL